MRGRPGCPTGQKKTSAGATGGSPLFLLLQGKVGYRIAPSSDPASPAHLPPKGKALGREEPSVADFRPSQGPEQNPICFLHGHAPGKKLFSPRECQLCWRGSGCIPQFWEPSAAGPKIPTPPSPPSWGAGRYGRWFMGRRPGRKKERTPAGSPQTRKGGSREEEPLPPWCSFLRLSSKESRAPARGRAGNGALRPEASKKPRPPEGYAVPHRPPPGAPPLHVSGSGSPRMVASGWKMAQKKSLSRARISRSSR